MAGIRASKRACRASRSSMRERAALQSARSDWMACRAARIADWSVGVGS